MQADLWLSDKRRLENGEKSARNNRLMREEAAAAKAGVPYGQPGDAVGAWTNQQGCISMPNPNPNPNPNPDLCLEGDNLSQAKESQRAQMRAEEAAVQRQAYEVTLTLTLTLTLTQRELENT